MKAYLNFFGIRKEDARKPFYFKSSNVDIIFLLLVISLSVFGTLMVFSAGAPYAKARYGDEDYFIKKQLLWLVCGFAVMIFTSRLRPEFIKSITPLLYIITLILLIVVLFIGFVGNGAKRWISIGPVTLQPSELAKIAIILIMAKYFDDNEALALEKDNKKTVFIFGTMIPIVLMLLPIILVMLQKHLSCIIILGIIGLLMIVGSGASLKYIKAACLFGLIGVTSLALFTDYTKDRITVWLNPEKYKLTGGWQTLQGLMAIGSGGFFGVGYGNSVMKHCYVSEPANDMIFSILCEELGLFGALVVFTLFVLTILRGFKIASTNRSAFSRLVAFGISAKLAVQTLLNVAVVTNTIPNTGISLPFFSYGGSSLVMIFLEMGIMLSISRNSKILK